MSRKIKALILAAFATLALSAVGASLSQAETDVDAVLKGGHTGGELTNTVLTGTQYGTTENNFFDAGGNKITCTNEGVNFAATVPGSWNEEYLTVTAAYQKCETTEGQAVTVTMNGCDYTFESPDTTTPGKRFTGEATLYCPHDKQIEVHVYLFRNGHTSHSFKVCTIKVGPKEGTHHDLGGHILYENRFSEVPTTDDITMWATLNEVTHEGCGSEGKDGVYETTVTFRGYKDLTPGNAKHEHTTEQLDLWLGEI